MGELLGLRTVTDCRIPGAWLVDLSKVKITGHHTCTADKPCDARADESD